MNGDARVNITQLVGAGDESNWSQVRVAMPLDNEEMKSVGGIVMVVKLKERDVELLEDTVEKFQIDAGKNKHDWLKQLKRELEGKIESDESVLVAVLGEIDGRKIIYLTGIGSGVGATLERKGSLVDLWPVEGEIVSGWLSDEDVLALGSDGLLKMWKEKTDNIEEKIEQTRIEMGMEGNLGEVGVVMEIKDEDHKPGFVPAVAAPIQDEEEIEEITKPAFGGFTDRTGIGLKTGENKKRKMLLMIGGVFLVLFMISVGVGMWKRQGTLARDKYEQTAGPIKDALTEAGQIKGVNSIRARSLVSEARDKATSNTEYETGKFADEWRTLKQEVERMWVEVSGEKQAIETQWFDLSIVKEGMKGSVLSINGEWVEVLDKQSKLVAAINLKDKSSNILIGGSDLDGVVDLGDGAVLASKGVWKLDPEKKSKELVVEHSEELDGAKKVRQFASNLYTLDDLEVWKFPVAESGIGARRRYFVVGVEPSLSEVVDMWIDGEIWLTTSQGKIMRFSRGQQVGYELKGWGDGWGEVGKMMTTETEVLVWDKGNSSVVIFDKETGEYKKKLVNDNLAKAGDLVIDSEGNRLIVVVDDKLLEMLIQ